MTDAEVIERLAQGEDSRTQFKCGPIGIAHLSEELAAFANAQGGVIFFGVDDEGTPVGLSRSQKKTLETELSNAANDGVRPSLYPRTEFHTIGGKQVLAVFVPEGVSKPYADKKGAFWTKSGPDKRRITAREELQRLLQRSLLIHADELPVEKSTIDNLDYRHLGEFLQKNYGMDQDVVMAPNNPDLPQLLENLGFADGTRLTLAGVMLFGKNPQRFLPTNIVKAVSFVGNDPACSRFRDTADFKGTIRDMYEATMRFLVQNLRHVQVGTEFNQLGELEISEEALKELVVNMFLHRDYFVSAPWRVMIFDDRVELISPGSLPNHLDIGKIKSGVSIARNPVIFSHATKEIPYRGLGTGVKRALELQPNIRFENDSEGFMFKVIVSRATAGGDGEKADIGEAKADIGTAKADIGTGKADIGTGKADIGETREDIALILSKLQSNTTERVQASTLNHVKCAYEAVSGKPFFKRSDIQVATGLAKTVASELLGRLLSLRIIVPVSGHGKGAYRFVEAGS